MKTIITLIAVLLVCANAHAMRKSAFTSSQAKKKSRLQYFNLLINNAPVPPSNQANRRIYDIDDLLSLPEDIPTAGGRWMVHLSDLSSPPVNATYIPAFPDNDPSENTLVLDLIAFFSEDRPQGYYNFRFETAQNDTSNTVCIHYPGSLVVVRSSAPYLNPNAPALHSSLVSNDRPAEFLLKTPMSNGVYTITGFNPATDSAIDFNTKAPVLDNNGAARASGPILFRFTTPGEKKINLRVVSTDISIPLHIFIKPQQPFILPLNVNDSNQNHIADMQEAAPLKDADGNEIPDPDLLNLAQLPGWYDTALYKMLTAPETRLLHEGKTFTLTVSNQLRLCTPGHKHSSKTFNWQISPDQPLPTWLINSSIEGITDSQTTGDAFIEFKITDGNMPLFSQKWKGAILHLQINHQLPTSVTDLDIHRPINQILNPAVIPILTEEEPLDTQGAKFQLTGSPDILLKNYADHLEWRVYNQNDNIHRHYHSTSFTIAGLQPSTLTIGVRLKWQTRDYLQFQKKVVHIKKIPLAFQFFSTGQDAGDNGKINNCLIALHAILPTLNIIARQAGLVFTPPPAAPLPSNHWKDLHIFAKIEDQYPFYSLSNSLQHILPFLNPQIPHNIDLVHHLRFSMRRHLLQDIGTSPVWWTGQVFPPVMHSQTHRIIRIGENTIKNAPFNINPDADYILTPELPENLIPSQQHAGIGFYHYSPIPPYITDQPALGKEYTAALSCFPNTLHCNFIKADTSIKTPFTRSWNFPPVLQDHVFVPFNTPNDAGALIPLTVKPSSSSIPALAPRQLNTVITSYTQLDKTIHKPGNIAHNINRASREILLALLSSLGLHERSLRGDLYQYSNPQLKQQAITQNILLTIQVPFQPGLKKTYLHSITPPTDTYYPSIEGAAAHNILDPQPAPLDFDSVRIDALQAQLLHNHPLIQSANP